VSLPGSILLSPAALQGSLQGTLSLG